MASATVRFACVAVAALAASRAVGAFPGRAGAASLWCPEASVADGLEPVLQRLVAEGPHAYGDSGVPENTPPPWYDRKRFAAGQRLTEIYPVGITYAHIQALYMVMAVPSVLDVLVYTGNSDTPDEAWDRYYDTVAGVGSWYSSDIYEPGTWGYEQMKRVRGLHRMVRLDMNERPDQEGVRNRTRLGGNFSGCPASAAVRRDLDEVASSACPFRKRSPSAVDNTIDNDNEKPKSWMSQYDMAMTQWAFVAPVILFPEKYGLANATEELLDGFVHMWETIGYSLGIEDKFNMCQGGLNATLLRARQAMATIVLPQMRQARPPWEYMARCMADGLAYFIPGADFNSQLEIMLRDTLDAPVPSVTALLSPLQRESVKGYRGIMEAMRHDRENWFFRPVSSAAYYILKTRARLIPKDGIKLLRHRNPHRSKDCFAEIRS
ncbi:uncharacterized protein LOC117647643 isoform X2 [Thrips palmi]|uniref:Uncharacterized protein LOC117647643 isoform X2 n=1 Tax=Thrips palmi TaxID=161013 RepID=A0A6P8ZBN7_THRPL|nr:uncharacterized protein LOC117647643 isoform X2 [Thrips palmi]